MANIKYEIIEKIGGGGMSNVYKAKCKVLNRFVAIKILRDELTQDPEFIDKFERVCYNDISSSAMSNFADGYSKACVSTLMKVCFKAFDGDDRAEERLLIDLGLLDVDFEVVRV